MADDRATFWNRLKGSDAGMLGCEPDWRLVPMSHYADPEAGALWFITNAGTDLAKSVQDGAKKACHAVADSSSKLYARIEGQLEMSDDKAKLDEIWSAVADSWFEGGERDPDVRLLKLTPAEAEVWATDGGLAFFYEIAKSKVTGKKPDVGEHFEVSFA